MADMIVSSVVQEGVNQMSSYISDKLVKKASREHLEARFRRALFRLELALEKTAESPITSIALLRFRMTLKQYYIQGTNLLLNKHRLVDCSEETGQPVASSSFHKWFPRARSFPITFLFGSNKDYLTSFIVQNYEEYADWADKFVKDVEFGCPLRDNTFQIRYPLERRLVEGYAFLVERVKNGQTYRIELCPVCSEGRGIEVGLTYLYKDEKMPGKRLLLRLSLRLSQGTSIVETAIICMKFVTESLRLLTPGHKSVIESAIGGITKLYNLQDFICSAAPLPIYFDKKEFLSRNIVFRPDPICCANNGVPSELLHGGLEPVSCIALICSILPSEYMLHSSTADVVGANTPLLDLGFLFMPHGHSYIGGRRQKMVVEFEGKEERISGSGIQLMEEVLTSRAFDCLAGRPESAKYVLSWFSPHGIARMALVSRPETECLKPTGAPRPRRKAGKRKR